MLIQPVDAVAKEQMAGILEQICQVLDLTASQHELAKRSYESVGAWLAGSEDTLL